MTPELTAVERDVRPMNKELFGVFGGRRTFEQFRSPAAFDRLVSGPNLTVGVRSSELGVPGRTTACETDDGACVLWGEVYPRSIDGDQPASWLLEEYGRRGPEALSALNGSFVAVADHDDRGGIVATDSVRSRECYYADTQGARVFGTDPATVAAAVPAPTVEYEPLLEFLYFGIVFDDRTVLEQVRRVPFDSWVSATGTGELGRFVYDPREFDYATELAERLRRALERRDDLPGKKGVLLSGGYDSRTILAGISDLETAYTVGERDSAELSVAEKLASQYGIRHRTLTADERYLNTDLETVRYGHGIMESLHIHHAGYMDQLDVRTIYHGGLADTVMRGHFQPISGVELFDRKCPPYRIDPDPDVTSHFAQKFGYLPAAECLSRDGIVVEESGKAFLNRRVEEVLDRWDHRFDNLHDGMALFGMLNQPSRPFRFQLCDQFIESCVSLDAELIEWHLATPPERRTTQTYIKALRKLDGDILHHRPPDRPHDSYTFNQIDNFLRRAMPFVSGYDGPWPDRERLYEQSDLDREIFDGCPDVQELPWRLKLRINDISTWLESTGAQDAVDPCTLVAFDGDHESVPGRRGQS
ncbi:asparagine synthase-related protein [Haloarcula onubensis]|uniref:Asparagine synthase-related protein n=1 Tax=Haloarcula onubensis TaxID=2950539 RepID=A0ABU2FPF3_9EURY|nr:asparagine synthase-related protein [Halomicroarcula sp. S3CR25-11]MDS0282638.1 asparagine synthase-related protein [Halomicroarcula sp. S3CR25-11]